MVLSMYMFIDNGRLMVCDGVTVRENAIVVSLLLFGMEYSCGEIVNDCMGSMADHDNLI